MSEECSSARPSKCKCKYRVRCFYSKGTFLVLLWTILKGLALSSAISSSQLSDSGYPSWLVVFPVVFGLFGAVLSGWLADAKFGNYKVMKCGFIFQFFALVGFSTCTLVPISVQNKYVFAVLYCILSSLFLVGVVASIITSLQLGLDQMPDASSSNITSFIAWFVFSLSFGSWLNDALSSTCLLHDNIQIHTLIPAASIGSALLIDFIFAKKWLIFEPKTPQSLKTIYKVLKFAAKHKAPLNRSALTYWEEDIPSRMDLGKSKYGGPFTTEQVEDVKTILRVLVTSFSIWVISFSLAMHPHISLTINPLKWTYCNSYVVGLFTYNSWWCVAVDTHIHEFVLYPMLRDKVPSIIKRIGFVSLTNTIFSIVFLILELVHHFSIIDDNTNDSVVTLLYSFSRGWLLRLLLCAMLEFVCAQAPYNMRGLFAGYIVFISMLSTFMGEYFSQFPSTIRLHLFGVRLGVSLFGFILYCVLARWYKRRVRDKDYCTQTVVEEVYDRYMSAQH